MKRSDASDSNKERSQGKKKCEKILNKTNYVIRDIYTQCITRAKFSSGYSDVFKCMFEEFGRELNDKSSDILNKCIISSIRH
jgi:hypothetical protein